MKRIVILGAGLTGLSAAHHLESLEHDLLIFEKEEEIGGLCRSINRNGFTFDYTGHLLHLNDPYAYELVEKYVGFDLFNVINRRSFIYSHETYTPYPFQVNLKGLPTHVIAECLEGFIKRKISPNPESFIEWVETSFGSGFAKNFFVPYQEKIFACDIQELTASWTGRFVPQTSLKEIIDGITGNSTQEVGYNATFFYPKSGGIHSWVKSFADNAVQSHIHFSMAVTRIDSKRKQIIFSNGHAEYYDVLISTIPLDILLSMLKEPSNSFLASATHYLRCNSVINFNLGINHPNISDKHWIYFPEPKYPFYRLGFSHNFSSAMAPKNCSSIYGEFSHIGKSAEWIHETTARSIQETCKLLNISQDDILAQEIITIPHAYVIFDEWRDTHVPSLLEGLKSQGIISAGRYGEWKYASMQEALLDGKRAAQTAQEILYQKPLLTRSATRTIPTP